MGLDIQQESPPLRTEPDGTVRVGSSRVTYDLIVDAFDHGAIPETIVGMYDTLDLADVYGAIAYYLRHRDEVYAYMAERDRAAEAVRDRIEERQKDMPDILSRLRARRR